MNDTLKGGLYLFGWLAIAWILMEIFPAPQSTFVSILTTIGSFGAAIFLVNKLEQSIINKQHPETTVYPEDWDIIRIQVLMRDDYRCGNCGSTKNLHVHHIVPLSRGGTNQLSNLRTICEECHKKIHPHMR